jgi:hypothetical protein
MENRLYLTILLLSVPVLVTLAGYLLYLYHEKRKETHYEGN